MAKIRYVSKAGGLMLARFDDDSQQTLLPSSNGLWLGSGAYVEPPPPETTEPEPTPTEPAPEPTGGAWTHPLPRGVVTSGYGPRDGQLHSGADISTPKADLYGPGDPIVAPCDLLITVAYEEGQSGAFWMGGSYVKGHTRSGTPYSLTFIHMYQGSVRVKPNQIVSKGTILGIEGNSGNSFGSHLHLEIWNGHMAGDYWYWGHGTPPDPLPILRNNGVKI